MFELELELCADVNDDRLKKVGVGDVIGSGPGEEDRSAA